MVLKLYCHFKDKNEPDSNTTVDVTDTTVHLDVDCWNTLRLWSFMQLSAPQSQKGFYKLIKWSLFEKFLNIFQGTVVVFFKQTNLQQYYRNIQDIRSQSKRANKDIIKEGIKAAQGFDLYPEWFFFSYRYYFYGLIVFTKFQGFQYIFICYEIWFLVWRFAGMKRYRKRDAWRDNHSEF